MTHENGTVLNKLHKAMIMAHMLDATIHCITYSQSVCTVSNALLGSSWFAVPDHQLQLAAELLCPCMHVGPARAWGDEVEED
jgi:hypothetical protein